MRKLSHILKRAKTKESTLASPVEDTTGSTELKLSLNQYYPDLEVKQIILNDVLRIVQKMKTQPRNDRAFHAPGCAVINDWSRVEIQKVKVFNPKHEAYPMHIKNQLVEEFDYYILVPEDMVKADPYKNKYRPGKPGHGETLAHANIYDNFPSFIGRFQDVGQYGAPRQSATHSLKRRYKALGKFTVKQKAFDVNGAPKFITVDYSPATAGRQARRTVN